uniref:Putative secreted protein n=1 Tax=Ixodes ricinus TaxID=34613 RepID=A0A6B0V6U5_IXORI
MGRNASFSAGGASALDLGLAGFLLWFVLAAFFPGTSPPLTSAVPKLSRPSSRSWISSRSTMGSAASSSIVGIGAVGIIVCASPSSESSSESRSDFSHSSSSFSSSSSFRQSLAYISRYLSALVLSSKVWCLSLKSLAASFPTSISTVSSVTHCRSIFSASSAADGALPSDREGGSDAWRFSLSSMLSQDLWLEAGDLRMLRLGAVGASPGCRDAAVGGSSSAGCSGLLNCAFCSCLSLTSGESALLPRLMLSMSCANFFRASAET